MRFSAGAAPSRKIVFMAAAAFSAIKNIKEQEKKGRLKRLGS